MDGFLYYRVDRPAIQQFARLAINSNDQHPTHHRGAATHSLNTMSLPVTPSQLHSTLLSALSPTPLSSTTSDATTATTLFPSPLVDLIVEYATCSSFIAAEADGAMHEYCGPEESQQGCHWRAAHTDALTAVTSLSDGQHCATASHDGRILVSRQTVTAAESGVQSQWREVRRIEHKHAVHALHGALAVDTSPSVDSSSGDGGDSQADSSQPSLMSVLVVGSSVGAFVYCPSTGRMLHELSGHTSRVSSLCVLPGPSHSASVVVSASWDGCCRVWSLQSMRCECVLLGRGKSLTCVAAVDRGCVVAGDVAGGVSVWQLASAMRAGSSAPPHSHNAVSDMSASQAAVSSSIASIHIAGHTSAAYVFRSPDTPTPPVVDLPSVQPSSHFSASSAATRAVLPVPSSGLLWVGSDDGLRLFAPSESGEWLCLRHITAPSPRGSYLPVHSLLWLSSHSMAAGMSKKLEVWNCESLLEESAGVESAARVYCEWLLMDAGMSVRSLAARHWLDITQPIP